MVVFLLVVGGIAFLTAFSLNLLPSSVYQFVYSRFSVGRSTGVPYLQKYEGHWTVTLTPEAQWSDVERCPIGSGTLAVHNGAASGNIAASSQSIDITARIDESGTLQGTFTSNGQNHGTLSGTVVGAAGSGSWKDTLDCSGTFAVAKADPVTDPAVGRVATFFDGVHITRGGADESPTPGESLYVGDVITVPQGATITIAIGTGFAAQPKTLTGPTTYTVIQPK